MVSKVPSQIKYLSITQYYTLGVLYYKSKDYLFRSTQIKLIRRRIILSMYIVSIEQTLALTLEFKISSLIRVPYFSPKLGLSSNAIQELT